MWSGRLAVVALLLWTLIGLLPLAYATPPDPSWVRGVYDDGDFDDVVSLITSTSAVVETPTPDAGVLGPLRFGEPLPPESVLGPAPEYSPLQPRAPPLA